MVRIYNENVTPSSWARIAFTDIPHEHYEHIKQNLNNDKFSLDKYLEDNDLIPIDIKWGYGFYGAWLCEDSEAVAMECGASCD